VASRPIWRLFLSFDPPDFRRAVGCGAGRPYVWHASYLNLIELNGDDLRRDPLEGRKATLEMILAKSGPGLRFNEHMEGDGETVFRHACKMGLEGIVSKRKDSVYRSGRSPDWLKMKNLNAPAVKREAEEDWGKETWR
jgi:bifunctional non-homologous end joining protein LigD